MSKFHLEAGQRITLPIPFCREDPYVDLDGSEVARWRPGRRLVAYGPSPSEEGWCSDGTGIEIRDVIAVVELPKPYPRRVFYKRRWIAPDDYEFGTGRVRCMALPNFMAWVNRGAVVA